MYLKFVNKIHTFVNLKRHRNQAYTGGILVTRPPPRIRPQIKVNLIHTYTLEIVIWEVILINILLICLNYSFQI